MDYNHIKSLLDKYWEGETSLQDENELKMYFSSNQVDEKLKPYKSLFQFFSDEREDSSTVGLEQKILAEIEGKPKKIKRISPWRPLLKYAAAIAFVMFSGYAVFQNTMNGTMNESVVYHDDPQDAIEAYNEVKAALALVSNKLDKGTSTAALGLSKTKNTNGIFKMIAD